ncbi:exodeoxyribonuclease III [Klugiella xanthotipulae]|uniref:Exodeoxyribonuclease-3 n=1 Tax=Klugiella xanthotipulae TaxID=244735 RepID=A0A543I6C4_9MICO|nr:exodeoxyribonuclease III [Klugiella xanthotipulae]TQM66153.1 exodeoxyribonuclease-3 [Klugiella xanthotipulae]
MRIATWNVNSIRARVDRVVDWLIREDVDVLAMQEIKCRPDQFPRERFEAAGYRLEIHGLNQWNGVAFASRLPMTDVATTFDGMPGFGDPVEPTLDGTGPAVDAHGIPLEARALGVTVNDQRLWSLYVPNGRSLDHAHYAYKLEWLRALRTNAQGWLADRPDLGLALMGDWNIAPFDADMGDPGFTPGVSTHISEPEREMFHSFEGLVSDVVRPFVPEGYTFWDYKQLRFPRNQGMRIDFIMGSEAFRDIVVEARIDRDERKGDGPSDHVPVVVEVDFSLHEQDGFDAGDDMPMIFG